MERTKQVTGHDEAGYDAVERNRQLLEMSLPLNIPTQGDWLHAKDQIVKAASKASARVSDQSSDSISIDSLECVDLLDESIILSAAIIALKRRVNILEEEFERANESLEQKVEDETNIRIDESSGTVDYLKRVVVFPHLRDDSQNRNERIQARQSILKDVERLIQSPELIGQYASGIIDGELIEHTPVDFLKDIGKFLVIAGETAKKLIQKICDDPEFAAAVADQPREIVGHPVNFLAQVRQELEKLQKQN